MTDAPGSAAPQGADPHATSPEATSPATPAGEGLAPLGSPAEAEVPQHTRDPEAPDDEPGVPLEETQAYELAVEDGAPLRPAEGSQDPGAGDLAPEFRAPGEG